MRSFLPVVPHFYSTHVAHEPPGNTQTAAHYTTHAHTDTHTHTNGVEGVIFESIAVAKKALVQQKPG